MPDTTLKISNQIAFSHVAWYIDTGKVTRSRAAQNATTPAFTCIDTLFHFNISRNSSQRRVCVRTVQLFNAVLSLQALWWACQMLLAFIVRSRTRAIAANVSDACLANCP